MQDPTGSTNNTQSPNQSMERSNKGNIPSYTEKTKQEVTTTKAKKENDDVAFFTEKGKVEFKKKLKNASGIPLKQVGIRKIDFNPHRINKGGRQIQGYVLTAQKSIRAFVLKKLTEFKKTNSAEVVEQYMFPKPKRRQNHNAFVS